MAIQAESVFYRLTTNYYTRAARFCPACDIFLAQVWLHAKWPARCRESVRAHDVEPFGVAFADLDMEIEGQRRSK